jgi:hypothetical protein
LQSRRQGSTRMPERGTARRRHGRVAADAWLRAAHAARGRGCALPRRPNRRGARLCAVHTAPHGAHPWRSGTTPPSPWPPPLRPPCLCVRPCGHCCTHVMDTPSWHHHMPGLKPGALQARGPPKPGRSQMAMASHARGAGLALLRVGAPSASAAPLRGAAAGADGRKEGRACGAGRAGLAPLCAGRGRSKGEGGEGGQPAGRGGRGSGGVRGRERGSNRSWGGYVGMGRRRF